MYNMTGEEKSGSLLEIQTVQLGNLVGRLQKWAQFPIDSDDQYLVHNIATLGKKLKGTFIFFQWLFHIINARQHGVLSLLPGRI